MGAFFYGWRPIAGCASLIVALMFFGLRCRSQAITDVFSDGSRNDELIKTGGGELKWSRSETQYIGGWRFLCGGVRDNRRWVTRPFDTKTWELPNDYQYSMRHRALGIEISEASRTMQFGDTDQRSLLIMTESIWKVSLLWLIIPPTLLSAWLLTKQQVTTTPIRYQASTVEG